MRVLDEWLWLKLNEGKPQVSVFHSVAGFWLDAQHIDII